MVFPQALASMLLASLLDFPVVFCGAVGPSVAVVFSATNIPKVPAVARISALSSLRLMASLLLIVPYRFFNILLLLLFSPVLVSAAVNVFRLWSPCNG
jgi:hypothetical protein